jgi:hypothetical protein
MACDAPVQGAIRLHELAMPFSIESTMARLIARDMPRSSALTISTRASGANPSSSLDRIEDAEGAGSERAPSMAEVSAR